MLRHRNGVCICQYLTQSLGWPNSLNVLDSKYGKVLTKKKNVPIIMIANELPKSILSKGPLQARFMRMTFFSRISKLDEARVIATFLWGCIQRRLHQVFGDQYEGKMGLIENL